MNVLLIEDDEDLGAGIVEALGMAGYEVHWQRCGDEGLYRALEWESDLIILDRMLPGQNGMQVLRNLRKRKDTPVLMLTALNTLQNRIEGLDGGADDYLGKPFELPELLARVRALTRRAFGMADQELRCRDLRLQPTSGRAFRGETEIRLTLAELRTLEFLLLRQGRIVTRMQLEDLLAEDGEIRSNTLDVHMHRLRGKLGEGIIETRRRQGYLIMAIPGGET